LRPKQGQKSGDILDAGSDRRTERDSTRHNNRKAIMRICGMRRKPVRRQIY
jgi:hypothetical protein